MEMNKMPLLNGIERREVNTAPRGLSYLASCLASIRCREITEEVRSDSSYKILSMIGKLVKSEIIEEQHLPDSLVRTVVECLSDKHQACRIIAQVVFVAILRKITNINIKYELLKEAPDTFDTEDLAKADIEETDKIWIEGYRDIRKIVLKDQQKMQEMIEKIVLEEKKFRQEFQEWKEKMQEMTKEIQDKEGIKDVVQRKKETS